MARLVPAKPKYDNPSEEATVLYLERTLNDGYIILQKKPVDGYMILHPELGGVVVWVRDEPLEFDVDTANWKDVDLSELVGSARKAIAREVILPLGGVAYLANTMRSEQSDPRIAFLGELENLHECIKTAFAASKPIDDYGINAILQNVLSGSMPFEAGKITDAQKKWREETYSNSFDQVDPDNFKEKQEKIETSIPVSQAPQGLFSSGFSLSLSSPSNEQVKVLANEISSAQQKEPERPDITPDDPLLFLLRKSIESALGDRPVYASGVQISIKDVVAPDFLLPALLLSAAERWATIVIGKNGEGGFNIRMRSDEQAITGYRVIQITPSTPFLLMLPVVDRIRRCFINPRGTEECHLDAIVEQFNFWLAANQLNTEQIENFSIAVALAV